MAKTKRVPQVLWRLFGDKAQCLSQAIISLIPKQCDCHSRSKCLRCVFHIRNRDGNDLNNDDDDDDVALAYLVRPDDPDDYKLLMNTCFVFVPSSSPPLPPLLPFSRHFSQLQIVERTIETCLRNQALMYNLICNDYQKFKASSAVVKLLSSSAWDLTLKRVGDSLMGYLLLHYSIFLCTRTNTHQQITGPPVNRLLSKFPIHIPGCDPMLTSNQNKRKRSVGNDAICQEPHGDLPCTADLYSIGNQKQKKRDKGNDIILEEPRRNLLLTAELTKVNGLHKDLCEEENSEKVKLKQEKRLRLPSWQRKKKYKTSLVKGKLDSSSKDIHDVEMHKIHRQDPLSSQNHNKGDMMSIPEKSLVNQYESCLISKPVPLCPCCSVFQSLSPLPKDAEINRKLIFYNVKHSSLSQNTFTSPNLALLV